MSSQVVCEPWIRPGLYQFQKHVRILLQLVRLFDAEAAELLVDGRQSGAQRARALVVLACNTTVPFQFIL